MKHRQTGNGGFTLVELMVVLLVMGVLLGLLLPALNMVKDRMLHVRQKAQFHTIEIGLEGFRADMGNYPPSYVPYPVKTAPAVSDPGYYGAQRLAEALVGQDGFGFHPNSLFRRDGQHDSDGSGTITEVDALTYDLSNPATRDQNLQARKGPYIELAKANALKLSDYGTAYDPLSDANGDASDDYVLADMFQAVKSARTSRRIGMPILYYRANTANYEHTLNGVTSSTPPLNIYMVIDNRGIYELPANMHPLRDIGDNGYGWWYNKTTNPAFPGAASPLRYPRPYRHDSFILHSAGPDGLYGTGDDVFNFEEIE